MVISDMDIDSFNPRILYISKEKYNRRNSLSYHFHPFVTAMYIAEIAGDCMYRIEGTSCSVRKGDIVICHPAVFHEKIIKGEGRMTEYHLAFDNISLTGMPPNTIVKNSSHIIVSGKGQEKALLQCFKKAITEKEKGNYGSQAIVKAAGMELIILLLRIIRSSPVQITAPDRLKTGRAVLLESVYKYITENYTREISIQKMARSYHVNPSYLCRTFTEEFGCSPKKYMLELRLKMAKELLENYDYPINYIAKSVGYEDPYHFSRLFRKHTGVTPTQYRNQGNPP